MKNLQLLGRCFFGIGVAGIGLQQFMYSEFRPVLLSYWPASMPGVAVWAYVTGTALVVAGALIIVGKKARIVSVALGILFFLLFLFFHVYTQVFLNTNNFQLGSWTDPLKELALSGGAFIIAASFIEDERFASNKMLLVLGRIFFATMLIAFGIDHFLYAEFVAMLVPAWIPGHMFWTYFSAVALIGSGICILFKIKVQLVSMLLGLMLFLWLVLLHIPRAITDPYGAKANEVTSVFEALAFSGIAFAVACIYQDKIIVERVAIQ